MKVAPMAKSPDMSSAGKIARQPCRKKAQPVANISRTMQSFSLSSSRDELQQDRAAPRVGLAFETQLTSSDLSLWPSMLLWLEPVVRPKRHHDTHRYCQPQLTLLTLLDWPVRCLSNFNVQ